MSKETNELIEPVLTETPNGEECSPQEVHSGDKLGDCYLKLGPLRTIQVDACADFTDPKAVAEIHPIPGKGVFEDRVAALEGGVAGLAVASLAAFFRIVPPCLPIAAAMRP